MHGRLKATLNVDLLTIYIFLLTIYILFLEPLDFITKLNTSHPSIKSILNILQTVLNTAVYKNKTVLNTAVYKNKTVLNTAVYKNKAK